MTRHSLTFFAAGLVVVALFALLRNPRVTGNTLVVEGKAAESTGDTVAVAKNESSLPASSEAMSKEPRVVKGVVLERTHQSPLRGATVTRRHGGEIAAETQTDESGAFVLGCSEGTEVLRVEARGFFPVEQPMKCRDDLRLILASGALLEGTVLTPAGVPAAQAEVSCIEGMQHRGPDTTAGDAGRFSLTCREGDLRLVARHPSGKPTWHPVGMVSAGASREGIVIKLQEGRRIAGRVVAASGEPTAAKMIAVSDADGWERPTLHPTSDAGEFDLLLGNDAQTIAAVAGDGRVATNRVDAGRADVEGVEVRLPAWGTLRGRLVGDAREIRVTAHRDRRKMKRGDPASIRESFSLLLARGSYFRNAEVDGQSFVFEGVEPGTYTLRASSQFSRGEVTTQFPADGEVVIRLEATATLALRLLTKSGAPVTGSVQLKEEDGGGERWMGIRDGSATAPELAIGRYELVVRPNDRPPATRMIEVQAGLNELTWTLPEGSVRVSGRVVDGSTASPIEGVDVSIAEVSLFGWDRRENYGTKTDESGSFTIDVTTATDPLFFWHESYAPAVLPANIADVRLSPGKASDQVSRPKEELEPILDKLRKEGRLYEPGKPE